MKSFYSFLFLSIALVGCATYSQLFVTPDGQIMQCSVTGQGVVGMATAQNAANSCKQNMLMAGYLEIERAGVVGIQFSTVKSDTGVRILRVVSPSPAQRSGIKAGDYLISIDGQKINDMTDARHLLFGIAGTHVEIVTKRETVLDTLIITRAPFTEVNGDPSVQKK